MIVEVCANSIESALNAQNAGADRIELCMELGVGGVTPSYGLIKQVLKVLNIPVHVLIRPRSGDFTYSNREFQIMQDDIMQCLDLGVSGIVSGVLTHQFTIDLKRTALLVDLTKPGHFTFHRAFDWISEPKKAIRELQNIGVNTILTSGQKVTALAGMDDLKSWNTYASHCSIMPGSGINLENIQIFKENGFDAIHLSGSKWRKTLSSKPPITMNNAKFLSDDSIAVSDLDLLKEVVDIVKNDLNS